MKEKIAGVNSIMEAIKGGRKIHKIYIQNGRAGKKIEDLINLAQKRGIYIQTVEKQRLDQMYTITNHQGVVAQVENYEYSEIEEVLEKAALKGEKPFIIILDSIEDPQNLGSIIRTAECAGVHGIVIPRHNSAEVTSAVSKASSGAVEHIHIVREKNLVNIIKYLKEQGMWIIGADMSASDNFFQTDIPTPATIVIGSEGKGIRRLIKENCDMLVKIPMKGKINSLNASIAAALLVFEVVRQDEKNEEINESSTNS
ncbi:23S rRNA (guanosine(2251)-2'-O)-methyltransferase [Candidatus Syntrophocurvum alkaliphilum]|uniref:23S rRNA (Guanosine(2251)-2'-O)-methyltransferase n=1 Tax=Candidatus Syntrophocurvum alkaliphilum TaxID=2293317 RepID=A0A6I6DPI6_9FIRM|nr:23S rRNA (guanosine(2251)-2'-O)-methyltransferase RlmB [Candidatus Syntrophocurvum alkaliphilum]QGU00758.1 23S rRNA (guanosine(2251)-2'-O)-methyltransferase [Candidatus Syntrophocurvum alkaliphilum]